MKGLKEQMCKYKGQVVIKNLTTGEVLEINNIVTNDFYNMVASAMAGGSIDLISHIAIGDDNTAATVNDTSLYNEVFRKSITNKSYSGDRITISALIQGNEANFVWKEVGLFNDASAGIITNRIVVNYTHTLGDVVSITWNIQPE